MKLNAVTLEINTSTVPALPATLLFMSIRFSVSLWPVTSRMLRY